MSTDPSASTPNPPVQEGGELVPGQGQGPDGYVVWRTRRDEEVCPLCAPREGRRYPLEALPHWPGDGDFGQYCGLGWGCRCSLTYMEADQELDTYSPPEGSAQAAKRELAQIAANDTRSREQWRAERHALYAQMTADATRSREAALEKARTLLEQAETAEHTGKPAKARDLRTRAQNWRERAARSHDALRRARNRDSITETIARELGMLPQDVPASEVALRLDRAEPAGSTQPGQPPAHQP